ncbi:MAG: S9 family peptidase [Acidobacteria bacterium]|nr:MAG: S9 family peptidase [Acidobacteriota bacterium]
MKKSGYLVAILAVSAVLSAADGKFQLSVDSIMRGPKLVGYPPSALRWSGDSRRLYFEWRRRDDDETSTWVVEAGATGLRQLNDDERKAAPPAFGVWDRLHRRVLIVQEGDIALIDSVAGTRQLIARTAAFESNPRWARNETAITFSRDNCLYLVPLTGEGDRLIQLNEAGPKKRDPQPTDSQKYLEQEEGKLIEAVKEAEKRRKKNEERAEKGKLPFLELTERQTASDLVLAHDERYLYALVSERATNAKRADVPRYVTKSGYTETTPSRTKAGDSQDRRQLAILDLRTRKQLWASLEAGETPEPERGVTEPQTSGRPPKPRREVQWSTPIVSEDGKYAVSTVRSADNEERWLVVVDPETGKTRVLDHVKDEAWVLDGWRSSRGFLPGDHRFWFLSEREGWMHLYIIDVADPAAVARQLTRGSWEVNSAEVAPDGRTFLITSSEEHPGEQHVYLLPVEGGERTKVSSMIGSSEPRLSPDGKMLGIIYSSSNRPPELFLMPNRPGAKAVQVTVSPSEEWLSYRWLEPQLLTFAARDGAQVFARLYTPEMLGAERRPLRPGVVFIHGAGYLQNAHKYWSTYYREYMFHHLLASKGYVVVDVDYRGSAGYGRDWRTAIYQHMGGKDLEDVVDAAGYLARAQGVDPKRIGVYGGSYGGFLTLMAMFTTPDVFAAGAALRPVTDWAHYSHGYTSQILNEPQDDSEAYRRSSPIYFADKLTGALLICHGMADTNVHFQDSVRLVQRLIELRKENWDVAVYPVEDHTFEYETSWADEYKRILKLFEENLLVTS